MIVRSTQLLVLSNRQNRFGVGSAQTVAELVFKYGRNVRCRRNVTTATTVGLVASETQWLDWLPESALAAEAEHQEIARIHSWTHGGWQSYRIGGDSIYFDLIKRPYKEKPFTDFFFRICFSFFFSCFARCFAELRVFIFILFAFHFIFWWFFFICVLGGMGCHVTVRWAKCVHGRKLECYGWVCWVAALSYSDWHGIGLGFARSCGRGVTPCISCQDDFNISCFVIDGQQFIGECPAV